MGRFWFGVIVIISNLYYYCIAKYSSHICMGGDSRLVPEPKIKHEYLCHFKNICYSSRDAKFLYYSDKSTDEIIRTVQHNFEYDFDANYLWFNLKSVNPSIDIIKTEIPTNSIDSNIKILKDDIVMHYSLMYYSYNYLFIDHFYAMWRTLKYFDLYDYKTSRPLFFGYKSKDKIKDYRHIHDNWNAKRVEFGSWDHNELNPQIGLKFIKDITSYIWNQNPLFLTFKNDFDDNDPVINNDKFHEIFEDLTNIDLICFDSIVIEMGYYFRHWEISYFIQLFTEKHHNKNPKMKQEIQKILILAQNGDDGRRHFTKDTNLEQIGKYLSNLFNIDTEIAYSSDIYLNLTLEEQIKWIEEFSIVIHSGGDDSYIHWFMREKTALITMDYFEINGGYTVHYDSDNIEFDPLKKTYYYYMTKDDMEIVEAKDPNRNRKFDSKNIFKYRLNPQRLAKYVYSALLWVEHWNEWDQTFKKPLEIPPM